MFYSNLPVPAGTQDSCAQTQAKNSQTPKTSGHVAIRLSALILMLLSSTGMLFGSWTFLLLPPPASLQSNVQASIELPAAVSTSAYTELQLQIVSVSGFGACSGEAILSGNGLNMTFLLDNPSGSSLPADTDIATIQVYDPVTNEQLDYRAITDSGGVLIVIEDY